MPYAEGMILRWTMTVGVGKVVGADGYDYFLRAGVLRDCVLLRGAARPPRFRRGRGSP